MPRAEGPYKVVTHVNDNTYKVDLGRDHGVHATFNVGDLSPYLVEDGLQLVISILVNQFIVWKWNQIQWIVRIHTIHHL